MGRLSVKMLRHLLVSTILFASLPAAAQQQSQGYKFLEAVRKEDGDAVVKMLDQPGQRIVNARDVTSGEGALHIVVKRGDSTYLRYLLQRGADPNMRDGRGDTPLLLAVQYGHNALVEVLTAGKANPNLGNGGGETPLIRAVQKRDLPLVRSLLAAGANPDQTDNIAGMSARDYARADTRAPAIAKLIDEKPKKAVRAVAGPRL
ncbi:ankyrin repeat domain-containing protein [Sphingomonas jeddahensis]|uniref:Ankyrin repeats (3 copies) n=1 Tax=Sphingomonas jeddahensis TaxID=1915074 RepID=A0A1V2EUR5_9SPHN|nr:ankyrin repeat domain-containing protein [Sphingomonas jeddahensis]ONF96416.1 Ankyrin repeats (3 copies) [Sphingomonas jeddahensis]